MPDSRNKANLAILMIGAILVFRAIPFFSDFQVSDHSFHTPLYDALFGGLSQNPTKSLIVSMGMMLFVVLFTGLVMSSLWVFEGRSLLPAVMMGVLLSSGGAFQLMSPSLFIPVFLLLVFYTTFGRDEQSLNPIRVYNVTLLVAIGSFFNFSLLLLIPLFVGLLIFFREFRLKTIWAMFTGIGTAYWILIAILLIMGKPQLFLEFFHPVSFSLLDMSQLSEGYFVYLPGLTLLVLVAFLAFTREYAKMTQSNRSIFLSSNLLAIYSLALVLLGVFTPLDALSTALISFSLIFSFYLKHARKRAIWIFVPTLLLFLLSSFIIKF